MSNKEISNNDILKETIPEPFHPFRIMTPLNENGDKLNLTFWDADQFDAWETQLTREQNNHNISSR